MKLLDFELPGEDENGGTEGWLNVAADLCAGSVGPAFGVVSESASALSEESSDVGKDCDSEAVELETGEPGSGAITEGSVDCCLWIYYRQRSVNR